MEKLCYNCCTLGVENGVCKNCGTQKKETQQNAHTLSPGVTLHDRYVIGRVLGQGGFGITYIGFDKKFNIPIAIKEYYPSSYSGRENTVGGSMVYPFAGEKTEFFDKFKEKFIKEAQNLSKFAGLPGIVIAKDLFLENNTAYFIMEYVKGKTLKQTLKECGKMSEEDVLRLMEPLMVSLGKLHKKSYIHRDISPDNIILQPDGTLKLIDFGASVETETDGKSTAALMKPGYSPEEQYDTNRKRQGTWSDVYALCATIYHMLEGCPPVDVVERLRNVPIKDFTVPVSPEVRNAIFEGLIIKPENRLQNVDELLSWLFPHKYTYKADENATVPITEDEILPVVDYDVNKPIFKDENINTANTSPNTEVAKKNNPLLAVIMLVLTGFSFFSAVFKGYYNIFGFGLISLGFLGVILYIIGNKKKTPNKIIPLGISTTVISMTAIIHLIYASEVFYNLRYYNSTLDRRIERSIVEAYWVTIGDWFDRLFRFDLYDWAVYILPFFILIPAIVGLVKYARTLPIESEKQFEFLGKLHCVKINKRFEFLEKFFCIGNIFLLTLATLPSIFDGLYRIGIYIVAFILVILLLVTLFNKSLKTKLIITTLSLASLILFNIITTAQSREAYLDSDLPRFSDLLGNLEKDFYYDFHFFFNCVPVIIFYIFLLTGYLRKNKANGRLSPTMSNE
jgi:serine/threonine protein kinase